MRPRHHPQPTICPRGSSMTTTTLAASRVHAVLDSPVGPLALVAADGVLTGLHMDTQRHAPPPGIFGDEVADTDGLFAGPAGQLRDYFAGRRTEFELPLSLAGTPFQRRVWAALQEIPYGETISYGELAARIGRPTPPPPAPLPNPPNPAHTITPHH